MKTALKADLEFHLDKWMQENCEGEDWPEGLVYEDVVADMAEVAAHVFDAGMKAQEFAAREESDDL